MKKIRALYKIAAMLIFPSCFILSTKAMNGKKPDITKENKCQKNEKKINEKRKELIDFINEKKRDCLTELKNVYDEIQDITQQSDGYPFDMKIYPGMVEEVYENNQTNMYMFMRKSKNYKEIKENYKKATKEKEKIDMDVISKQFIENANKEDFLDYNLYLNEQKSKIFTHFSNYFKPFLTLMNDYYYYDSGYEKNKKFLSKIPDNCKIENLYSENRYSPEHYEFILPGKLINLFSFDNVWCQLKKDGYNKLSNYDKNYIYSLYADLESFYCYDGKDHVERSEEEKEEICKNIFLNNDYNELSKKHYDFSKNYNYLKNFGNSDFENFFGKSENEVKKDFNNLAKSFLTKTYSFFSTIFFGKIFNNMNNLYNNMKDLQDFDDFEPEKLEKQLEEVLTKDFYEDIFPNEQFYYRHKVQCPFVARKYYRRLFEKLQFSKNNINDYLDNKTFGEIRFYGSNNNVYGSDNNDYCLEEFIKAVGEEIKRNLRKIISDYVKTLFNKYQENKKINKEQLKQNYMNKIIKKGKENFEEKYKQTKENIEKIRKEYLGAFNFEKTDDFKTAYDEFSKQYKDFDDIFKEIKDSVNLLEDNRENVKNYINSFFDYLETGKEENKISEYIKTNQLISDNVCHRANVLANYRFLNVLLYFMYKFYANNESIFGSITTKDIKNLNSNARRNNDRLIFLNNIIKSSYLNLDNIYNSSFDSAIKEINKNMRQFEGEIIPKIKEQTFNVITKDDVDKIKKFELDFTKFLYYKINKLIVVCLTHTMSKAIENFKNLYKPKNEVNYTLNKIEPKNISSARKKDLFLDDLSGYKDAINNKNFKVKDVVLKQMEKYCKDLKKLLNISNIEDIENFISDMYYMNIDVLQKAYDDTLLYIANIGGNNLPVYTQNLVNKIIGTFNLTGKYENFQMNNKFFNDTVKKIREMIYGNQNDKNLRRITEELRNLDDEIIKDEYYKDISAILNNKNNENFVNYLNGNQNINKQKLFELLTKNKFSNYDMIDELLKNENISKRFFNNKPLNISKIFKQTNNKTDILTECLWLKSLIYSLYECYSKDHFIANTSPASDPIKYYKTNKLNENALSSDLNFPYMFLNNNYLNIKYEYEKFFEDIMNNMDPKDKEKYEYISKENIVNECYKKNKYNHFDENINKDYINYLYREISLMFLIYINNILEQIIKEVNKFDENEIPENFLYNNFFKKIDIDEKTVTNEIIEKIYNNEAFKKQYHDISEGVYFSKDKEYALILNFIRLISKEIYAYIFSNYFDFQEKKIAPIANKNQKNVKEDILKQVKKATLNFYNSDIFQDLSFFKIRNKFRYNIELNHFFNKNVKNFEDHPYYKTAKNLLDLNKVIYDDLGLPKKIYEDFSDFEQDETDRYRLLANLNLVKFVLKNAKKFNKDNNNSLDFTKSSCISNTANNVLLECELLKMYLHMLYYCYINGLTFAGTSNFMDKDSRYWFDEESLYDNRENGYKTPYYPISWQFPCQIRLHSNLKATNIFKRYLYSKLTHLDDVMADMMKHDILDATFSINFEKQIQQNQNYDEEYIKEARKITEEERKEEKKNDISLTAEIKKEREDVSSKFADFLNGRQKTFDEFSKDEIKNKKNKVTRNIGNIREEYLIYIYTEISKMFFVKIDELLNNVIACFNENKKKIDKNSMVNESALLENVFQKIIGDNFSKEIFNFLEEHRKTLYEKINFNKYDENGALFLAFIKAISRDIHKVVFRAYQYCKECVENLYQTNYIFTKNLFEYIEDKIKENGNILDINSVNSSFLYLSNENFNAFRDVKPTIFLESIRKNKNAKKATNIEDEEEYKKYDNKIFIEPQNSNIVCYNGKKFKLKNNHYFEENENDETINNILQQIENKNTEQTKEIKEFLKRDEEIKKHVEDLKNLKNSERLIEYFNVDVFHRLNRDIIDKIKNGRQLPSQQKTIMHIILYLYKYFYKEIDYFLQQQFSEEKRKNNYEKLNNLGIKDLRLIQVPRDIKEYFKKLDSKDFILNSIKYDAKRYENSNDAYERSHKEELDENKISVIETSILSGDWLDVQIKLDSFLFYPEDMYFFIDIPLQILRLISQNPAYSKDENFKNMLFYNQKRIENNIINQFKKEQDKFKKEQDKLKKEQDKLNREQDKLSKKQLKEKQLKLKEKQLELNLKEKKLKLYEKQLDGKIKKAEKNLEISKLTILRDFLVGMWQIYEEAVPNMKNFNFLYEYHANGPKNYFKNMFQNYYDYADKIKSFPDVSAYIKFIRGFFPYNILDLNFLHDYLFKKIFKNSEKEEYDDFIKKCEEIEKNIENEKQKYDENSKLKAKYNRKKILPKGQYIQNENDKKMFITKKENNQKFEDIDNDTNKLQEYAKKVFLTNLESSYGNRLFKDNKKLSEHLLSKQLDFANKVYLYHYIEENKIIIMAMIKQINKHIDALKTYEGSLSEYKKNNKKILFDIIYDKNNKDGENKFFNNSMRINSTLVKDRDNKYFKKPNAKYLDFLWDVVLYSGVDEKFEVFENYSNLKNNGSIKNLSKNIIKNLDNEKYSNIKSYKKLCNMLSLYDKDEKIIKDYMERYNRPSENEKGKKHQNYKSVEDFKHMSDIRPRFKENSTTEKNK